MQQIQLTSVSEVDAVLASKTQLSSFLAHLKAPLYSSEERQSRAPVVLSAVLDRSGSMQGTKLALVKKTMKFVIRNMKAGDQLGIISYDSVVKVELPVTSMTQEGQQQAIEVVQRITDGGSTNLSGGLFEGIKQIHDSQRLLSSTTTTEEISTVSQSTVNSVWLFTDGLANEGIQDAGGIKQETETRLAQLPSTCSLFTFGFGSDHNSSMLQAISKVGNGMYYYIETEDTIPSAFSDCLGGLLSVAAQNLHLTASLVTPGSAQIVKVHTAFRTEVHGDTATVHLPDLYSEEARDIIFDLQVNSTDTPCLEPAPFLTFTLQYFNVITCAPEEVSCVCEVRRPAEESQLGEPKPVPVELDMQRNRVKCMEALAEAHRLSERGNIAEAREALIQAITLIERSVSGSDRYCQALLVDLRDCLSKLRDQTSYQLQGCHTLTSSCASHAHQRGTHRTLEYATHAKCMMVARAQRSFSSQDEEE